MMQHRLLLPLLLAVPVTPLLATQDTPAAARARPVAAPLDAARKRLIEAAIAKMSERYVFPQKVPAIAKALRKGLASGKYDAPSDPGAFIATVNRDIEDVARDRHLQLHWSPEPLPPPPDPSRIDPVMAQRQADFLARRNYAMRKAEILDGNIGYLKINGFVGPEDAGATMAAAMAFLKHSDAMILDLRGNGGGDPATVAMLMSYFVPPDTLINTFHQRDKAIDDQVWALPYVPGGRWSTGKPVYVLTSDKTASGGEEFAYDMQQLKRGIVIGGVTWGGANPGEIAPLDAHFAIFVPTGAAVNPVSKTNWEGVGVKPDVLVDPEQALDKARQMALAKMIEQASGERRAELQQFLTAIKPTPAP